MPWMYILRCADDSYYVGSTADLEHRMEQHSLRAGSEYTRRRLPVALEAAFESANVADAHAAENQVQGWSRAKREALIRGDFDALPGLARKRFR